MYDEGQLKVQKVVQKLTRYLRKRLSAKQASLLEDFANHYYANVVSEDVLSRDIEDLYGALLTHWDLIRQRKRGEFKLKIYNPEKKKHGWESKHTIVELVSDNMPFLVESIRMEVNRYGLTNHWLVNLGGMKVVRDSKGVITKILPLRSDNKKATSEAVVHMEIDRRVDLEVLENLRINLLRVLQDVQVAVEDWQLMVERVQVARSELRELLNSKNPASRANPEDLKEAQAFLGWMEENFIFLGYRCYKVEGAGKSSALCIVPKTGVGVLREGSTSKVSKYYSELPVEARKLALSSKDILVIAKTNTDSTVHRRARTDYISIKQFNEKGAIIGEHRFVGLFTSVVYSSDPLYIPILRRKVQQVVDRSGLSPQGYDEKRLLHIIRTLPRDDLIQGTEDQVFQAAMAIMHFDERRRIRFLVRPDVYNRFISCLVYVPRESFNTELRMKMQKVLMEAFDGRSSNFTPYFPESSILARVHYEIYRDSTRLIKYDLKEIEQKLIDVWRSWKYDLRESLLKRFGEERGNCLWNKYQKAFPAGYQETFSSGSAAIDIDYIERLKDASGLEMSLYRPRDATEGHICFRLFRLGETVPLSDVMPMLENMGLRVVGEHPYRIVLEDGQVIWINNFNMTCAHGELEDISAVKEVFQASFSLSI